MTPQNIAEKAGRLIDDELLSTVPTTDETNFVLDILNEFQEDIAEAICPVGTSSNIVVADVDTWYSLPTDFIRLYVDKLNYTITKDAVKYTGSYEIRRRGEGYQIRFPQTGTYTVDYEKPPTTLTALNQSLTMHPLLQSTGAYYLASKYLSAQENATATFSDRILSPDELMQQYQAKKGKAILKLTNPSGQPEQVINVY